MDEGNPDVGKVCDSGLQGICSAGAFDCQNGPAVCVPNVEPFLEMCDNLDSDCDGQIDNGNPGGGAPCETGLPGVCSAGTMTCQSGLVMCLEDQQSSPEACDDLDNDCDGVIDGFPTTCGVGACVSGGVCTSGTDSCTPGTPISESCDLLDNNCDGAVDNVSGADDDGDSVDNACDNCPHAYNPGQQNTDGDAEGGDFCDITVTYPLDGDVTCSSLPPTITWTPEVYSRFKVFIGADPEFSTRVNSGKKWLAGTRWTVPVTKWTAICGKTHSTLYIRVMGKAAGSSVSEYSETDAITVK